MKTFFENNNQQLGKTIGQLAVGRSSVVKIAIYGLFFTVFCALTSCEDPKNIGLNLATGGGQVVTSFTDTTTVTASTMLLDSAITSGRTEVVVGSYKDPVFGPVEAKSFFQVNLPAFGAAYSTNYYANYDLKYGLDTSIDIAFDSAGVYLAYNNFAYGKDTLQNITLSLYPLLEKVDIATNYTSSNSVFYDSKPLATKSFTIRDLKNANGDSTKVLKFVLPSEFGRQLFALSGKIGIEQNITDLSGNTTLGVTTGDNDKFHTFLQGFALVAKQGPNIIYSFNLANSSLYLKYHHVSGGNPLDANNTQITDSTKLTTDISYYSQQFVFTGGRFSQIKVNRQGTSLAKVTQPLVPVPASQTGGQTFIQNGTGITTKIVIPYLKNLSKLGKVSINKAELVFNTPNDSINNYFPPKIVGLFEIDKKNTIVKGSPYLPAEGSETSGQAAGYDIINKRYKFNVTTYLQDLLAGKRSSDGLMLATVLQSNGVISGTNYTNVARAVFPNKAIKLNIYYSVSTTK